ncbi:MAG: hypothetical protein VX509_03005, partial [Verrucomicrobiota bacterium]|nr:hypothetical protein [Verrucomicrobiota bacterium]
MNRLSARFLFVAACVAVSVPCMEASDHWAFTPGGRPSVPAAWVAAWQSGAMDHFVLAKLRENGMR